MGSEAFVSLLVLVECIIIGDDSGSLLLRGCIFGGLQQGKQWLVLHRLLLGRLMIKIALDSVHRGLVPDL